MLTFVELRIFWRLQVKTATLHSGVMRCFRMAGHLFFHGMCDLFFSRDELIELSTIHVPFQTGTRSPLSTTNLAFIILLVAALIDTLFARTTNFISTLPHPTHRQTRTIVEILAKPRLRPVRLLMHRRGRTAKGTRVGG